MKAKKEIKSFIDYMKNKKAKNALNDLKQIIDIKMQEKINKAKEEVK